MKLIIFLVTNIYKYSLSTISVTKLYTHAVGIGFKYCFWSPIMMMNTKFYKE